MTKHAKVTFALDADFNDAFAAAAESDNRSVSDILREFMGDYVRYYEEAAFAARRAALANSDG